MASATHSFKHQTNRERREALARTTRNAAATTATTEPTAISAMEVVERPLVEPCERGLPSPTGKNEVTIEIAPTYPGS
jgi:hypothetical protein